MMSMFHVEMETTSIFKNSLSIIQLYAILKVIRKFIRVQLCCARN